VELRIDNNNSVPFIAGDTDSVLRQRAGARCGDSYGLPHCQGQSGAVHNVPATSRL
jgi:hypothetical protein